MTACPFGALGAAMRAKHAEVVRVQAEFAALAAQFDTESTYRSDSLLSTQSWMRSVLHLTPGDASG